MEHRFLFLKSLVLLILRFYLFVNSTLRIWNILIVAMSAVQDPQNALVLKLFVVQC